MHGRTRDEAVRCMRRALHEMRVEGVKTTIPVHQRILQHPDFLAGRTSTQFLARLLAGTLMLGRVASLRDHRSHPGARARPRGHRRGGVGGRGRHDSTARQDGQPAGSAAAGPRHPGAVSGARGVLHRERPSGPRAWPRTRTAPMWARRIFRRKRPAAPGTRGALLGVSTHNLATGRSGAARRSGLYRVRSHVRHGHQGHGLRPRRPGRTPRDSPVGALPILAIGGITLENVAEVIAAGATAPAVISAVVGAADITAAAAAFRQRVVAAKARG